MSKAPAFQFYVRDWLCSRKVFSMSGDAVKAYIYLLCESWLNEPRATLPNNNDDLIALARTNSAVWDIVKNDVLKCFKIGEREEHKGLLYNEKLLELSRNYEKNQRPNNKNALRTRTKREPNAKYRTASASASASSDFKENISKIEEIYNAYPRKIGCAAGKAAIKKALKKISFQQLLEKVQLYARQSERVDQQFIPYPATWFNQERWNDETPVRRDTGWRVKI